MAAELSLVPELGDGDGGDGGESNLGQLAALAQRVVEAHIAKIDWDVCSDIVKAITDEDADAATLLYLMKRSRITVTVEGAEELG